MTERTFIVLMVILGLVLLMSLAGIFFGDLEDSGPAWAFAGAGLTGLLALPLKVKSD